MKNVFFILVFILLSIVSCHKDNDDIKTGKSTAVFNSSKTYGTVKDIDGNNYKTIVIGNQTWMAENLRATHYQNGDSIPNVKGAFQWGNLTSGAFCSYNNTIDPDSIATFGYLYNGYAVIDNRNMAPEGWHVPTYADWDTLETFVAAGDAITDSLGNAIAGGRLKEADTLHWGQANHADNISGFTALPGGQRDTYLNKFKFIGYFGAYWTSSLYLERDLFMPLMVPDFVGISTNLCHRSYGNSVRCIKDR